MANIVILKSGTAEYVVESTFGTFPTDPAMQWIGLVQSLKAPLKPKYEEYRTLKNSGATNKLELEGAEITGGLQPIEIELEYLPQDWTFLKYAISSSGGGTPTDDLASLSIGLISSDSKYAKLSGAKIDSVDVEIPEAGFAKVSMKLIAAHVYTTTNNPWSSSDYIGLGTHATKNSNVPVSWDDVSNVTLGGAAIPNSALGGIKFSINNNLDPQYDLYSSLATKIGAIEPAKRDFKASLTVKKKTIDAIADKAVGFGANDLVITVGATTFTFANARIPEDAVELAPTDLVTLDVDFVGITNMTIA